MWELSREEVEGEVLGAKRDAAERVGFVVKRWVDEVRQRRRRARERQ